MFSKLAYGFGAGFILIGLMGFCQYSTTDGLLLGYFAVDTVHNLAHLATGAIGLLAGYVGKTYPRKFLQLLGIAYAIVAAAGFYFGDAALFGIMANNMYDVYLHSLIAAVGLYMGFFYAE